MKKLDIVEEYTIRLTAADREVLATLMGKYGSKNKAETIRQALLDALVYISLPKDSVKPILSAPEKKELPKELPTVPPPSFLPQTQKKLTIEELMDQGCTRHETVVGKGMVVIVEYNLVKEEQVS